MALMESGADIDARDNDQSTPLHYACDNGLTEVAMALIKRGADCRSVTFRDSSLKSLFERLWNFSPLMCALYENDLGSFRALLEAYDESSDVSSADGWGVLHAGVYLGRRDCLVLYLQSERVSVVRRGTRAIAGEYASTVLHIACARGDMAMIEVIVEQMSLMR
jgi:ankyrin repeat protein